MTVKKQDWGLSKRGLSDAARHREKIRETIQKNIADIISDSSIITKKGSQTVKIPIRGIKSYKFIYQRPSNGGAGVGQGKGDKGDIIGKQPLPSDQPGSAGDQPGVDYLETEIDLEELIEMMLNDLGLPNLKKKEVVETAIPKGWKFDSIEKTGIMPHLDKKRSIKEAIKRTSGFVFELMQKTGRSELDCSKALSMANGSIKEAEKILIQNKLIDDGNIVRIFNDDLRFRTLDLDIEYQSNAVVLAMLDVSGSMTTIKKYLARSFFFWMVNFLRQIYKNVEIRFIAHTTEAKLVDEYEFFHKMESGGTFCYSAYDLAIDLVEKEYPTNKWNVYAFHFSDGEDFDLDRTIRSAQKLMDHKINMLGYGEIAIESGLYYGVSSLINKFVSQFSLKTNTIDSFQYLVSGKENCPFIGVKIGDKSHIYPSLKAFLRKDLKL